MTAMNFYSILGGMAVAFLGIMAMVVVERRKVGQ